MVDLKPDWLEQVWMEVQAEIDAEELGERMDAEEDEEDMSGPQQDWERRCYELADKGEI